jgi:hypothetical protein
MSIFGKHGDALFRIGSPAVEKATLCLSPIGALIWSAFNLYQWWRGSSAAIADDEEECDEDE